MPGEAPALFAGHNRAWVQLAVLATGVSSFTASACDGALFTAPAAESSAGAPSRVELASSSSGGALPRDCPASAHPIVFISSRAGEFQLFVMSADGGETTNLSRGHFRGPVWSPDGESIAFRYHYLVEYQTDFATEVGVMAADGSERVALVTEGSGIAARLSSYQSLDVPSWSTDGEELAFASQRGAPGEFRAWGVSRWGGQPRLLLPEFRPQHAWPSFGPATEASQQIAVVSRAGGEGWVGEDIWVGDVESSATLRNVTQGRAANPEAPRWSPDGGRIAFSAESTPGDAASREIYVLELSSGELTRVTSDSTADVQAAWSPDGNALVVSSEREQEGRGGRIAGEQVGLWLVPLDDPARARPLTPSPGGHGIADWFWSDACGR